MMCNTIDHHFTRIRIRGILIGSNYIQMHHVHEKKKYYTVLKSLSAYSACMMETKTSPTLNDK